MCSFVTGSLQVRILSRLIQVIACFSALFLFFGQIIFHCMGIHPFVYPFICRWTFKLFHLGAMDNAAMHTHIQGFVWTCALFSLGYILGVELLGHVVTMFNQLRNCFPKQPQLTFPLAIPFWTDCCIWCELRLQLHSFVCHPIVLAPFFWKDYSFPIE